MGSRVIVDVLDTPEAVAEAGAKRLLELARGRVEAGKATRAGRGLKLRVALSGGSTPKAMYDVLRRCTGEDAGLLRKVRYFFGDERAVPNDHPESNVKAARSGFLMPLGVPAEQIYAPNGGAQVLSAEAWRLTLVLERTLPRDPETEMPQFDLIYLGMGPDGHTASLFPGTEALAAQDAGYVMNEVPQLKTRRLTLTYPVLNAANELLIMVTGDNKAAVLEEIFTRPPEEEAVYPIELLNARRMHWILDRAAARLLTRQAIMAFEEKHSIDP